MQFPAPNKLYIPSTKLLWHYDVHMAWYNLGNMGLGDACCLTVPSHYLKQGSCIVSWEPQVHNPESSKRKQVNTGWYRNGRRQFECHANPELSIAVYPRLTLLRVKCNYRQVSNIRRTKSQHLKYSRIVLRLSLPNPLKPVVKSRMKM